MCCCLMSAWLIGRHNLQDLCGSWAVSRCLTGTALTVKGGVRFLARLKKKIWLKRRDKRWMVKKMGV